MAWGKEWPEVYPSFDKLVDEAMDKASSWPIPQKVEILGLKEITEYERKYNNKMPTHDPYTNPNAHIYYQCACGAILDPGTKSFAQLNNHASIVGWKIRFREIGYVPYCVKCGEGVE